MLTDSQSMEDRQLVQVNISKHFIESMPKHLQPVFSAPYRAEQNS